MEWYYASGSERVGPLSAQVFEAAIKENKVTLSSLVWSKSMAQWQAFSQVAQDTAVCAVNGGRYWKKDMVPHGEKFISAAEKDLYFQKLGVGVPTTGDRVYAGFWIRFCAKFIDGLIVGVVGLVVNFLLALAFFGAIIPTPGQINGGIAIYVVYNLLTLFIRFGLGVLFQWYFLTRYQATPGKIALKLKVVRGNGSPLTTGVIIGRAAAELLSGLILCIGYIIAAFDEEKRSLHDRLADTRVIVNNE